MTAPEALASEKLITTKSFSLGLVTFQAKNLQESLPLTESLYHVEFSWKTGLDKMGSSWA